MVDSNFTVTISYGFEEISLFHCNDQLVNNFIPAAVGEEGR